MVKMACILCMCGLLIPAARVMAQATTQPARIPVLIVDGMNNHDWQRGTKILKEILEGSGRFEVGVSTCTKDDTATWRPEFQKYKAVVMNFNGGHTATGAHWSTQTQKALEEYVSGGGGLVVYHAANNAFLNWPAYNEMIGVGWRGKDFGVSVVITADEKVRQIPKGQGRGPGHGPEHDFLVTTLDPTHPITRGMPKTWLHPHDQLTHGQHGPANDMTILTYAWSKDTKENEPMDWVIPYGKGRVYTTMLGHLWKDGPETAVRCVGFQTLLIRGTEWAATGAVTYDVPSDFPTAKEIRLREKK